MELRQLCTTASGLPVFDHVFGPKDRPAVVLMGGVHGDEPEGVALAQSLLAELVQNYVYSYTLHIIPSFNPDGLLLKQRTNANNVDLNRNLPTRDWQASATKAKYPPGPEAASEAETKALVELLESEDLRFIFSLHSFERYMIHTNFDCSPIDELLHKTTGYEIKSDIGYPAPGSLGTYAGLERKIPTITYEIERGLAFEKVLAVHKPAFVSAFQKLEEMIN